MWTQARPFPPLGHTYSCLIRRQDQECHRHLCGSGAFTRLPTKPTSVSHGTSHSLWGSTPPPTSMQWREANYTFWLWGDETKGSHIWGRMRDPGMWCVALFPCLCQWKHIHAGNTRPGCTKQGTPAPTWENSNLGFCSTTLPNTAQPGELCSRRPMCHFLSNPSLDKWETEAQCHIGTGPDTRTRTDSRGKGRVLTS